MFSAIPAGAPNTVLACGAFDFAFRFFVISTVVEGSPHVRSRYCSAGLSPGLWGSRRFVPGSPASSLLFTLSFEGFTPFILSCEGSFQGSLEGRSREIARGNQMRKLPANLVRESRGELTNCDWLFRPRHLALVPPLR